MLTIFSMTRFPFMDIFLPGVSSLKLLSYLLLVTSLQAADFHVSPRGDDMGEGTAAAPFASLAKARDAARRFVGKEPVTIHVADGTYDLPEALVFAPNDSGTPDLPVVYRAENEGRAVISGGLKLDLKWAIYQNGVFQARTPAGISIDQVFINGVRQRMARYPNFDPAKTTDAYQGYAADAFSKERAARWKDPAGGFIHAMHAARWGGYHYRITGKDASGNVTYEGGWQNNRQMGMHKEQRMVENIFEELDAPGEWFHDAKSATLYYMPNPGEDLANAVVEVVRLPRLVEFRGGMTEPVHDITLSGFVFRHTARTFMETKEPLLRSDWTIHRGGAILLTGTEHVSITDCEFDQPGGNAVFFNNYNRKGLVKGCHIHDTGASGVCFVGDPGAVRDPLFEYGKSQDLTRLDPLPGPKTENYPADCVVEDNLIHGIGRVERQPAGVQISMSSRITVRDCSIYDCARSGINISEGTWGGHLIEGCDVFDTVLETHDHGSFNSWGRDRFWQANTTVTDKAVAANSELPFLDAYQKTTIRGSRWRCDHGWDIDLDDGSTHYEIYNNLLLHGGLKFREGYRRKAWNNVILNNGFYIHVWYPRGGNEFTRNIVMRGHSMVSPASDWAAGVDHNFFTTATGLAAMRKAGSDAHSISGDPKFVDPVHGDFRVSDDSPVLKTGFKNFPMDRFGVKKPSLRTMARTPVIPGLVIGDDSSAERRDEAPPVYWLGARLHALVGEEFSAFGVAQETGGVQLVEIPPGASAAAFGMKRDDLIIALNESKTPDLPALFAALSKARGDEIDVEFVRDQKPVKIRLKPPVAHRIETAKDPGAFTSLKVSPPTKVAITTHPGTNNEPVSTLTDGRLADNYGPVFSNGVNGGIYKLDLGTSKNVTVVRTWSGFRNRTTQRITVYGSNHPADPGWNVSDGSRFTPIGSIDTRGFAPAPFTASSLEGRLGRFRWILWQTATLNGIGENTAFQELGVTAEP